MPGITGCINLSTNQNVLLSEPLLIATKELMHETSYRVKLIKSPPGSNIMLIDQGINDLLAGTSNNNDLEISVGFYGEFHGTRFKNARNGNEVADIIVSLYDEFGEGLSKNLDGSFILFIYDYKKNIFLIINDHYASRPLFYSIQQNKLYFSPEIKGIIFSPDIDKRINLEGIISFLVNGFLLSDQTYYQNIYPLLPGTMLKIENSKVNVVKYDHHTFYSESKEFDESFYINELSSLLMGAVKKRLYDTANTVIPISGGYDSRGILGCACKLTKDKVRTVTWGTDENQIGADAHIGRLISEHLGTEHTFFKRNTSSFIDDVENMNYRIDGLTDDACFHHNELTIMYKIRDELNVTTLMRGDECFGYQDKATNDIEALGRVGLYELDNYNALVTLLNPSLVPELKLKSKNTLTKIMEDCSLVNYNDKKDYYYYHQRLFHYLNRSSYYKLTVLNLQNPWLDKEVLKFYRTIPAKYRFDKYLYKKTLAIMFPELYSIPFATSNSLENWLHIIQNNVQIQNFIRLHLLESRNELHNILDVQNLSSFLVNCFTGAKKPSLKSKSINFFKVFLERYPYIYITMKSIMINRIKIREISDIAIIFRLLALKFWFDIHAKTIKNLSVNNLPKS